MAFNTDEQAIIKWGLDNGKSKDEVVAALGKYRSGFQPSAQTPPQPTQPVNEAGLGQRVMQDITSAGTQVGEAIRGEGRYAGESPIRRGVEATATAFTAPLQAGLQTLPVEARKGLGGLAKQIGDLVYENVISNLGNTKYFQEAAGGLKQGNILEESLGTAAASGTIAGDILAYKGVADVAQKGADVTRDVSGRAIQQTQLVADDFLNFGKDLRSRVQAFVGGKNIGPQVEESSRRLFLEGAQTIDNPLKQYNQYLSQAKGAIKDAKLDPPIASVGEDIGNAFNEVVQQRKAVGQVMGSELKKFGSTKIDIKSPVGALQRELIDSGATFDASTGKILGGATSKFSPADINILQTYADELLALGKNPTAAQIDAFISRIPNTIKALKATGGINFYTNAERIVNSNLNGFREALSGVATPEYLAARTTYSELSNFVNEGARFLGKVTQSGDFARDASLAKSAVQSVLSGGKKDWLLALEGLTGKQLLDRSVLALQAMKDAGDFKALSLLETLSSGSIPTSHVGLYGKIIDFLTNTGTKVVAGSPEEQTRAFLNALAKGPQTKP